jgi:AraC-like DNA-binding protein
VATELAMSTRSLQRRLTEDGLSFQGLLSETRHQLALEHLADRTLEIIEVAYMLL